MFLFLTIFVVKTYSVTLPENTKYEYIIITSEELKDSFQPLAEWKTRKGVPTKIEIVENIYENYSGDDNQEQIKNYIADMKSENNKLEYILLGGSPETKNINVYNCDSEICLNLTTENPAVVPIRNCYIANYESGSTCSDITNEASKQLCEEFANSIPTDLYYSALKEDKWDSNENGIYGEFEDIFANTNDCNLILTEYNNLIPQIYITRLTVKDSTEVDIFINKLLNYEKGNTLFNKKILFLAGGETIQLTENTKDEIKQDSIPPSYYSYITKLYYTYGNLTRDNALTELNDNKIFRL